MRTSISNLNGEQQNKVHLLNKSLKKTLSPLMIICFGNRSAISFRSSAFSGSGTEKNYTSVFDIFLIMSDGELLSDDALLTRAKGCCPPDVNANFLIFRLQDVKEGLRQQNRFLAGIFRKGILLYGNKDTVRMLTNPLPPLFQLGAAEQERLKGLFHEARQFLLNADAQHRNGHPDPVSTVVLLHQAAVSSLKYYIGISLGICPDQDLEALLNLSRNISSEYDDLFPRNTPEEMTIFQVLNLRLIDAGFSPGDHLIRILLKRVFSLLSVTRPFVQRKIGELLPA